jgi:hypothetical protein
MQTAYKIFGYCRDALIIACIIGAALYFLNHPEKFDALLNATLGRR